MVVKQLGPSKVARASGINRVTLYRMLSKDGNPSLKNLVALFKAINIHFWIVESEIIEIRERALTRSGR